MTRNQFKAALIATHGTISPAKLAQMLGQNGDDAKYIVQSAIKQGEIQGLGKGFRNHAPKAAKAKDLFVFRSSRA